MVQWTSQTFPGKQMMVIILRWRSFFPASSNVVRSYQALMLIVFKNIVCMFTLYDFQSSVWVDESTWTCFLALAFWWKFTGNFTMNRYPSTGQPSNVYSTNSWMDDNEPSEIVVHDYDQVKQRLIRGKFLLTLYYSNLANIS